MLTKVIDDRETNEKQLYELEPGEFFMMDDLLMRRADISDNNITIYTRNKSGDMDTELIHCIVQTTGELTGINRLAWVEPVKAEIHVVG
mgnify:CR=1 FL=1